MAGYSLYSDSLRYCPDKKYLPPIRRAVKFLWSGYNNHMNGPHKHQPLLARQAIGGVILCGGKSSRMGTPKCLLPFGDELMLPRIVRILSMVVSPIVVVAAPDQELPELPADVILAHDRFPHWGPLNGMLHGLSALPEGTEAAYISSCDVPLLKPEFIMAMVSHLGEFDLAVPREEKFYHPLAGVYRKTLVSKIRELIDADRMRPLFLIEASYSRPVSVEELLSIDPELHSLKNVNSPEDYKAVLRIAGHAAS